MRTALLSGLAALALAGCYGGRGGHHGVAPRPAFTTWDASFEGLALDDRDLPAGEMASPVLLRLTPLGGGKYSVAFDGVLPFLVFDAFLGLPVGWFDLPMQALDRTRGDFVYEPGFPARGTFTLWARVRIQDFRLGFTDVELVLHLRPDSGTLETSDSAQLSWDASLDSSGTSLDPFPGFARSSGFATVAYRLD